MSVFTRQEDGTTLAYIKGSPEMIRALSVPSTIPATFEQELKLLTQKGFRVIAYAMKHLPDASAETLKREQCEVNLEFLGLLWMENHVKDVSPGVITNLKQNGITVMMATGDNILTAISVAQECKFIKLGVPVFHATLDKQEKVVWGQIKPTADEIMSVERESEAQNSSENAESKTNSKASSIIEFGEIQAKTDLEFPFAKLKQGEYTLALTGAVFEHLMQNYDHSVQVQILNNCSVFARMSPEQKALLVEFIQGCNKIARNNEYVMMCGDGANDCAALKTADAGISLADSEASIAAPFTSKVQDISCVPALLMEGRACLEVIVLSFRMIQFYAITEVITMAVTIWNKSYLTDHQFMYVDLILVFPMVILQCYTQSRTTLTNQMPGDSLLSLKVVINSVSQHSIQILFALYVAMTIQDFEDPAVFEECVVPTVNIFTDYDCTQNTATFLLANFQYLTYCLILNCLVQFRRQVYTNWLLSGVFLVMIVLQCLMVFKPELIGFDSFVNLVPLSHDAKVYIMVLVLMNAMTCMLTELVINKCINWNFFARRRAKKFMNAHDEKSQLRHKLLAKA